MKINSLINLKSNEAARLKIGFSNYFTKFFYENFDANDADSKNAKFLMEVNQTYFSVNITREELNVEDKISFLKHILSSITKIIETDNNLLLGDIEYSSVENISVSEEQMTEENAFKLIHYWMKSIVSPAMNQSYQDYYHSHITTEGRDEENLDVIVNNNLLEDKKNTLIELADQKVEDIESVEYKEEDVSPSNANDTEHKETVEQLQITSRFRFHQAEQKRQNPVAARIFAKLQQGPPL